MFGYRLVSTRVECNESIKIDSIALQFSGGGGLLTERKRKAISEIENPVKRHRRKVLWVRKEKSCYMLSISIARGIGFCFWNRQSLPFF